MYRDANLKGFNDTRRRPGGRDLCCLFHVDLWPPPQDGVEVFFLGLRVLELVVFGQPDACGPAAAGLSGAIVQPVGRGGPKKRFLEAALAHAFHCSRSQRRSTTTSWVHLVKRSSKVRT